MPNVRAADIESLESSYSRLGTCDLRGAAVEVDGLRVRLHLQRDRVTSLRERVIRFVERRPKPTEEFWPVDGISFTVGRGEAFGVVGTNGAGKSTLLKVIAGVIRPTIGTVRVAGSFAPLLELGAGFDSELTGEENVFLYGSLLGIRRSDLVSKYAEIVDFAELDRFMNVPLKNYSSGMVARLGFAVATALDTDILIIDETLAVGDARFNLKCLDRIAAYRERGVSILFVSHDPEQVRELCARALWIEQGVQCAYGETNFVLGEYGKFAFLGADPPEILRTRRPRRSVDLAL